MNRIFALCGWLMMLMLWTGLFASCEHKELCYDHGPHAERIEYYLDLSFDCEWEYHIENYINWEEYWKNEYGMTYDDLRPEPPEGVRVHIYDEYNNRSMYNLTEDKSTVRIDEEGLYSVLFYNNDTEYIVFDELDSYATAKAFTRGVTRATYKGNSLMARNVELDSKGEYKEHTVNPPDMLFGAYRDEIEVKKMNRPDTLAVTLHPLVFTYLIRYEFESGLEYVSLARGALAGMAKGVRLSDARTLPEQATILYDCELKDFGVDALVKSFGVPDYPNDNYSRGEQMYGLNLEVRLKNGNLMTFEFDITEQMAKQPHGGVIVVKNIVIPDDVGQTGSGGFDVNVNDWGVYEDVVLPL